MVRGEPFRGRYRRSASAPVESVPNIFEASASDFAKATMRVYHELRRASRLEVTVVR